MAGDGKTRDTEGGEIGGIQAAFSAACGDGDDAAEGGCALEEGQEVGDEAKAGVECQGTQQVDMLGRFYSCLSICCFVLL